MIIMLQWMHLYTLGSRGSGELKTFLEIHLISSRIDQKLKNKREIHRFLKRILAKKSWVIDAVVGADCRGRENRLQGSWERFSWAASWLQSHDEFRFKRTTIAPRSGHDRIAIGPRSRVDRDLNSPMNVV